MQSVQYLVVDENSLITMDRGIAKIALKKRTLMVSSIEEEDGIILEDYTKTSLEEVLFLLINAGGQFVKHL